MLPRLPRPLVAPAAFFLTAGLVLALCLPHAAASKGSTVPTATRSGVAATQAAAFPSVHASAPGTNPPLTRKARSRWRWPLRGDPAVVHDFDPPTVPWGRGHRGIDLEARIGEPVLAAGAGRVLYAGMLAGRGVVSIVHGKLRTTYEPVSPTVHTGQTVSAGQRIGRLGDAAGHCVPQHCLHWGLLRGADYLNPLSLLGRGPVRLLPVWDVPRPYVLAPAVLSPRASLSPPGLPSPRGQGLSSPAA